MNVKAPQLSVIMPAYNAQDYIKESIDSVLSQSFPEFELIVINDGSKDETEKIIQQYDDLRIKYISNEHNLGLIKTLNKGINEAKGKFIARLDSDDICEQNRFETQFNEFAKDAEVVLVSSWSKIIDKNNKFLGMGNWSFSPESIFFNLIFRQCIPHSSVMFKKDIFLECGGYDENAVHIEDFDLWRKIANKGKIIHVEKPLIAWRDLETGICSSNHDFQEQQVEKLFQLTVAKLSKQKNVQIEVTKLLRNPKRTSWHKVDFNFIVTFIKFYNGLLNCAPPFYNFNTYRNYVRKEIAKNILRNPYLLISILFLKAKPRFLDFIYIYKYNLAFKKNRLEEHHFKKVHFI